MTEDILRRWQTAAERALDEGVRILEIDGEYRATSSSRPLGSYVLRRSPEGWTCDCVANREYGLPCKHLSVLADSLGLDILSDMRIDWNAVGMDSDVA